MYHVKEGLFSKKECKKMIAVFEREAKGELDKADEMLDGKYARFDFTDEKLARLVEERLETEYVVSPRFYVSKYWAGGSIEEQFDGNFESEVGGVAMKSAYSVVVYLNSDFSGGGTQFSDSGSVITPVTGKCLVFDQKLEYSGKEVVSGIKYILRTDLMNNE